MSERTGAELKGALDVLDFRCGDCDRRVLPGQRKCLDCKYGPLNEEQEEL